MKSNKLAATCRRYRQLLNGEKKQHARWKESGFSADSRWAFLKSKHWIVPAAEIWQKSLICSGCNKKLRLWIHFICLMASVRDFIFVLVYIFISFLFLFNYLFQSYIISITKTDFVLNVMVKYQHLGLLISL